MRIILIILSLSFAGNLVAQADKVSKKSKSLSIKNIDLDDTEQALTDLQYLIRQAKASDNLQLLGDCYVLLGEVYQDIEQYELAANRHETALSYFEEINNKKQIIDQYISIGKLYLKINQLDKSKYAFERCITLSEKKRKSLICQEGLADVYFKLGESEKSLDYYDSLDSNYTVGNVSQSNARIKLKKAKAYATQKDESKALENYRQGSEYYSSEATQEDLDVLEETKESIIELEPSEELPIRQENVAVQSSIPNASYNVVRENVKITENLVKSGDIKEAKVILEANIESEAPPSSKKDFYKISADINALEGDYEKALSDLKQYERLTKQVHDNKTAEQDRLITVLKSQRLIDLEEKDYTIKSNRAVYDTNISSKKNWIIGLLSALLLGALIALYYINKNIKARKQANQLLLLKSLRAQMNPHFIFNVLNSINNYISKNDERSANKYLSEFSKLMRKVLQDSQKDLITLEDELEMASIYLKLEHTRFDDKFDYSIDIDDSIDLKEVKIPPMMIQPFLENAVWHGMRYKTTKGTISLDIIKDGESVKVVVEDDGIGREKSKALKTSNQKAYKSTGLDNVANRLSLVNDIYGQSYNISIENLKQSTEEVGTKVTLIIAT